MRDKPQDPDTCTGVLEMQPDGSAYCERCGTRKTFDNPKRPTKCLTKEEIAFNEGVEAAAMTASYFKYSDDIVTAIRQLKKSLG